MGSIPDQPGVAAAQSGLARAEPGKPSVVRHAPLVLPAIALAIGIAGGFYLSVPTGVWLTLFLAAGAIAVASFMRFWLAGLTTAAILSSAMCGGALSANLAYWRVADDSIIFYSDYRPVPATLRGQVASLPEIQQTNVPYQAPPTTLFMLDVTDIARAPSASYAPAQESPAWLPAQGQLRVTVGQAVEGLLPGTPVELVGTLYRFRGPSNPGQFDWQQSQRRQDVMGSFNVPAADGVTVGNLAPASRLAQLWQRLRLLARRHVLDSGEHQDALLVDALVLGDRDPALRHLNQAMVEAGTAHLLSISGSHMAIFLGFVFLLCRLAGFSRRRGAVIVLALLALYVPLTTPSPPLLRSALMAAAICIALVSGRAVSTGNALAAAAIVLLVIDPLELFTAGFQLSFGIVAGITCLYQPIKQRLFGRFLRRRGLIVFRHNGWSRVRRWLYHGLGNWGMATVAVSLAAYIASAPLVAYHFGLFSPYASLLTVALLPIMTCILIPAYLSLALSWLLPGLSASIAGVAATSAGWMQWLVMKMAMLPGISFDLYPISPWLVGLFYVAVAAWTLARRSWRRYALATAASLATLVLVVISQQPAPPPANPRLHVLDVAHGSMTLLENTDGQTSLIDAGTLGGSDCYQQVLRPFLRAMRLRHPRTVFVSHANWDHYSALPAMVARHRPDRLYLTEYFGRADDPPSSRSLVRRCEQLGTQVIRLSRPMQLSFGTCAIDVLWPPAMAQSPGLSVNDSSLVLGLCANGQRVLLPGDIGPVVETALTKEASGPGELLRAGVLVLPHHGSATPTLKAFITAIGSQILVQSNTRRQTTPALLDAIGKRKRYATFREGWICIELAKDGPVLTTMRTLAD